MVLHGPAAHGIPASTTAIVAATLSLLEERGYSGLSFAAVANTAGTTKPAIYRRWSSKRDLVLEAVFRTQGDDVVANTGDLDADMRTMVVLEPREAREPCGSSRPGRTPGGATGCGRCTYARSGPGGRLNGRALP